MPVKSKEYGERGSALVYILIAIALLAALTFTFMEPSSQQTSSQNTFKTVQALQGQVDVIRSAVQECVLSYPKGDSAITAGGDDPGARDNYPINPNSDFYIGSTDGQSGDRLVRNLRCPGNNTGAQPNDHELLFGGASGKYLQPAPDLFSDWQYYNGTDGIYFWTETDKSDAFLTTAMTKLDEEFSECEADLVDATGGAVNLDSAGPPGDTQCTSGSLCFRVWLIANTATNEYNGDTDGDEGGCP
ncbi:MAG: hypothetical protein KDJ35_03120 [Alphaproteobacteria bacterium]|nr:hypothetical protein [Alphaproteobacteria bacterium]